MKLNGLSVEKWWNEICCRGKRGKHREKATQFPYHPPQNTLGMTETRTRDLRGEMPASSCATEPPNYH